MVIAFRTADSESTDPTEALRLRFMNSNPEVGFIGEGLLPSRSHYLDGNDSSRSIRNVRHYEGVKAHDLYPGIDFAV